MFVYVGIGIGFNVCIGLDDVLVIVYVCLVGDVCGFGVIGC